MYNHVNCHYNQDVKQLHQSHPLPSLFSFNALYNPSSHCQLLSTSNPFLVPVVLSCPECHINDMIYWNLIISLDPVIWVCYISGSNSFEICADCCVYWVVFFNHWVIFNFVDIPNLFLCLPVERTLG